MFASRFEGGNGGMNAGQGSASERRGFQKKKKMQMIDILSFHPPSFPASFLHLSLILGKY
jgi:hypothetical protein